MADDRSYKDNPKLNWIDEALERQQREAKEALECLFAIAGYEPEDPIGYDGFGAPLYAHQVPPEGTE